MDSSNTYRMPAPPPTGAEFDYDDETFTIPLIRMFDGEISLGVSERDALVGDIRTYRDAYNIKEPERDTAWDNAANYQSPNLRSVVDGMISDQTRALDVDPFWVFRPRSPEAKKVLKKVESFIDFHADKAKIREKAIDIVSEAFICGTGVAKVHAVARRDEERGAQMNEYRVDTILLEDFFCNPPSVNIEDATVVGEKMYVPYWRIEDYYYNGTIFCDPEDMRGRSGSSDGEPFHGSYGYSENIEIWELWFRWGADWWTAWYSRGAKKILRCVRNPYSHKQPPYAMFHWWRQSGRAYGDSAVKILLPTQDEINGLLNMRMDANALAISPPIEVYSGSEMAKSLRESGNSLAPRQVFETNMADRSSARVVELPQAASASISDLQVLYQNQNNLLMPQQSQGKPLVNRDPTATEVRRDMSFTEGKQKTYLFNLHQGFKRLGELMRQTIAQYDLVPVRGAVRFLSDGDEAQITAAELYVDGLEIEVNGRETQTAKVERQQGALLTLQIVPQMIAQGLTDHPGIYTLLSEFLNSQGTVSPETILGKPRTWEEYYQMQASQQMLGQMMSQEGAAKK